MDFGKAFDKVPHGRMFQKIWSLGSKASWQIRSKLGFAIEDRIGRGIHTDVTNGCLQRLVLESLLYVIL